MSENELSDLVAMPDGSVARVVPIPDHTDAAGNAFVDCRAIFTVIPSPLLPPRAEPEPKEEG